MSHDQGCTSAEPKASQREVRDYLFTPIDTLFFREGQAFHQGETNHIDSAFPPTPRTFQGLIRSKFLRDHHPEKIANSQDCDRQAIADLVGPPERPSQAIEGPHLLHWDGKCATPYLVLPHFWWMRDGQLRRRKLVPRKRMASEPNVSSSHSLEYQPYPGDKSPAPAAHYLPWPLLRQLLYGELAAERSCLGLGELGSGEGLSPDSATLLPPYRFESRTLVAIDQERGSKRDGMLNFTRHIRLEEGFGFWCRSGFALKAPGVAPLGGMGRLCRVEELNALKSFDLPEQSVEKMAKERRFWLILTQPMRCAKDDWQWQERGRESGALAFVDSQGARGELPVRLLSAVLGPPQWIGGYDLLRRRPAGQHAYLSPGSAYLFEIDYCQSKGLNERLQSLQGGFVLGNENEARMGFGQVLVAPFSDAHT